MTRLSEDFKVGENVAVIWKKQDNSAYGGTDGVVLGVVGDEISGKYLIIDRSTYADSFKSILPFLNILDLRVIPLQEVNLFEKLEVRKRPPGILENSNMTMEVDYRSNLDFYETILQVEKRGDCSKKRTGNNKSETYQFSISNIQSIQEASIQISCKGTIQIYCRHTDLDSIIKWLNDAAKLLPEQKTLVLVPTKVTYKIHSTFKDPTKPAEELIDSLGRMESEKPLILPVGWIQRFFVESDKNPLQDLFPETEDIHDLALENTENNKKQAIPTSENLDRSLPENLFDSQFLTSGININKYLGAGAPILRAEGLLKTPEDEKGIMQRWMGSRRDLWNWFTIDDFEGKIIMRDLTFDKKTNTYVLDFRKYYGTDFDINKKQE